MKILFISILCFWMGMTGCGDSKGQKGQSDIDRNQSGKSQGNYMNVQKKLVTPYDDVDIWTIPEIVPFGDEQREYVIKLFSVISRVIEGRSKLEVEEKNVLGEGKFFWPKDPAKKAMIEIYYPPDNFRMHGISLQFLRADRHAPWTEVHMTLHPRNFPKGAYDMQLPSSMFEDFRLEKVIQEERPDEIIEKPIVFYLRHKSFIDMVLVVESQGHSNYDKSTYPSSFHALKIVREVKR